MAVLEDKVKEQVKEMFKNLSAPVRLIVFTQESSLTLPIPECPTCKDNRLLMEEISSLSDKINIVVYDYMKDKEKVAEYNVDKIPATVIQGEKDYGIRIYGLPAGYEFVTLIDTIKIVAAKNSGLSNETKEKLKLLTKPVHIQVFVTLSCPYCPVAAEMGHKMAIENERIRSDTINAQEFPHLAQKYNVLAVPKVVVNEDTQFEGALPEADFLQKIIDAAG